MDQPLTNIRRRLLLGLAIALSVFVLIEVNFPLLQPQSRLALFGMLGLVFIFLSVPALKKRPDQRALRIMDGGFAVATVLCFGYVLVQTEPWCEGLWFNSVSLGDRAGQEVPADYLVGFLGLVLVLEASRRTIGLTLPLLALVFLLYARFGSILPRALFPHRGYDGPRIASQAFLHSQGAFGIALKVMFTYVFPFILFGVILEITGATRFIIDGSRRLLGKTAGGPAKVAVLSSGLMGSLSGSAVANTATTGTFTIPMMRSAGFPAHVAAGIEAAASSGGALMPPIMGAGAYMMLEIVTPPVTYLQIIRAALIPAILYYATLLMVVHFQARKVHAASTEADGTEIPRLAPAQGFILVVSILSLVAILLAGRTPFRAVTLSLGVVLVLSPWSRDTRFHLKDLGQAVLNAARTGAPLIAAAACVGLILGMVTLTGIGSKLPSAILPLAQDHLLAALFLLMVSTIILGMGLPSAVCYLLMATLVGPVLAHLGLEPLAAHMFIFYFGMMSMVTPPVALAAYTSAAIAKADILRSSLAAFRFALVGFVLPYAFVLNPALLLLPAGPGANVLRTVCHVFLAFCGIMALAAGTVGFVRRRLNAVSRVALILASLALLLVSGLGGTALVVKLSALVVAGLVIGAHAREGARRTAGQAEDA